jgi:hypothetical protein
VSEPFKGENLRPIQEANNKSIILNAKSKPLISSSYHDFIFNFCPKLLLILSSFYNLTNYPIADPEEK